MNGNRVIVHTLIKINDKYLVTKRSKEETAYAEFWDTPGGLVEIGETPREGIIRETKEEVGLDITPTKVIHEDSNYDTEKDMIFIRLVYLCDLDENQSEKDIVLQEEEHSEYRLIDSLDNLEGELITPFLEDLRYMF